MAREPQGSVPSTRERALDVAEMLVQHRGFNGFSYADVASELGITTASLHYHYRSKADLGKALVARYTTRFLEDLAGIDARIADAGARLEAYAELYATVLRQGRFCLCGMLAGEYETLPKAMRDAVIDFFDQNEAWLVGTLRLGERQGVLRLAGPAADAARLLVYGLEGAMLVARPYGEIERFKTAAAQLVLNLAPKAADDSFTGASVPQAAALDRREGEAGT